MSATRVHDIVKRFVSNFQNCARCSSLFTTHVTSKLIYRNHSEILLSAQNEAQKRKPLLLTRSKAKGQHGAEPYLTFIESGHQVKFNTLIAGVVDAFHPEWEIVERGLEKARENQLITPSFLCSRLRSVVPLLLVLLLRCMQGIIIPGLRLDSIRLLSGSVSFLFEPTHELWNYTRPKANAVRKSRSS